MCKELKKKKKTVLTFLKIYDTSPYLLALRLLQQSNFLSSEHKQKHWFSIESNKRFRRLITTTTITKIIKNNNNYNNNIINNNVNNTNINTNINNNNNNNDNNNNNNKSNNKNKNNIEMIYSFSRNCVCIGLHIIYLHADK